MFKRILIANRAETARRIARTCRALNIEVVAIASAREAQALHAIEADTMEIIGSAPANQAYLCGEQIIAAARKHGAQAIHPGDGFLAENPAFARTVAEAGLAFVGPSAATLAFVGNRAHLNARMSEIGLPVLGVSVALHTFDSAHMVARAEREATRIGYPLVLKDCNGDAPIEIIENRAGLTAAFKRLRIGFFGGAVYLEQYVPNARQIEVQVLADGKGRVVHMFARETSISLHHQKIIAETAPVCDTPPMLQSMAVRAAAAIGYSGAGTLKFLVAPDGQFFFMGLCARMQAEQCVTEAVLGIDLVEHQLRVASGAPYGPRQPELSQVGHAINFRINAERRAARPAVLTRLDVPGVDSSHVRLETGVCVGEKIVPSYAPLLAKLTVWGIDRAAAVARAERVLADTRIEGLPTNLDLHRRIVADPTFRAGGYDSTLVARLHD